MIGKALALLLLNLVATGFAVAQSGPVFLERRPGEDVGVVDISEFAANYPKKILDEYEEAVEDARKGNVLEATARLEAVVKSVPEFYAAHRGLGVLYQRLERYEDAKREYGIARDLNPRSAAPLVSLGGLHIEEADASETTDPLAVRGMLNEALESLQQALKLQPSSGYAHYLIGIVYYKTMFYEEAEDHLQRAVDAGREMGFARLALANVYIRMLEWDSVVEQLDAYLKSNPWANNRDQIRQARQMAIEKLDPASK
jgi:tetratricopeptide (TPR) repeat protein